MKMSAENRAKNDPTKYPRISFRVKRDSLGRLLALREKTGMTFGQLINVSLRDQLPILERKHD